MDYEPDEIEAEEEAELDAELYEDDEDIDDADDHRFGRISLPPLLYNWHIGLHALDLLLLLLVPFILRTHTFFKTRNCI